LEKDVTLVFAKALRAALEENGRYEVVLTREGDEALPLRARVERARVAGAALFMSLHADALPQETEVHGLSVYTLSDTASDAEAAALAQKENRADIIAGVDLSGEPEDVMQILIDLAQRQTMSQSVAFAEDLTHALRGRALLVKNAHRAAGFRVLKAPDVPSVLIELGYLSNALDLENITSDAWQRSTALAIAEAVDRHFEGVDQRRAERSEGPPMQAVAQPFSRPGFGAAAGEGP
jgi:N-acetylmuramoyl-L-alanine amidase